MIRLRITRLTLALAALALLAGCASFSPDGGFGRVEELVQERLGAKPQRMTGTADMTRLSEEVERLLAAPLSADSAVQIALINNRGLQAHLAKLGIVEAELVQAGRPRNPGFSYGRFARGDEREYERSFLFDLMWLITQPARSEIEQRRFEHTQLEVAGEVLHLAQTTRQAWFAAVAAQEAARQLEDAVTAARAGAELAARMAEVGNFSRLRQQREQLLYAELAAELARARLAAVQSREHLTRLMGLAGTQRDYVLPDRLPALPPAPLEEPELIRQAMERRLDVRMARAELEGLAKNLGLTRSTGLINVLEVGWLNSTSNENPVKRGYEIELKLPIFDWGQARTARAEALYTQAMHRVAEIAVNAQSEVAEAYAAYRAAYDLARHYRDEVLPLTERIAEEGLLRYNGMLIDVWNLLADARGRVRAMQAATTALRDFWMAEANVMMALDGKGAGGLALSGGSSLAGPAGKDH
ncbi:MAG: TolC family protein [Thiobacillaceae bacterium]